MGYRKITIKLSVAESIAEIAWFLESEGLPATAEKFAEEIYDFIEKLGDNRKKYRTCREPQRILMGYKCISYKKKYTIVFIELDSEIIVCEFISSKMIYW
eukprot:TRINITY_DN97975_c0_g1_i1.p2 TRINITY_DN97975_c0_g1~~TRINITY_DN97975_c0_g1_i1.p2  ORF type:complete len:100 (-),score=11.60 TRINITY_DN97975_c0_g1_i1:554-853(-)